MGYNSESYRDNLQMAIDKLNRAEFLLDEQANVAHTYRSKNKAMGDAQEASRLANEVAFLLQNVGNYE